ncbi:MAG: sensor histidine kinase [Actinobacteria bacterium HGW-Actinobacteria-10]|nr:MAG: sensor histidine kinase [Actinobacteria bacterium HGW-Actinobacteria-10]
MQSGRTVIIDMLLVFAATVLAIVAAWALIAADAPRLVTTVALSGLTVAALGGIIARFVRRPDHIQAMQSHLILEIANESLAYLRQGLNETSAQAVCRISLSETDAAAVAITDTERILGFAGIGEDHHEVGGPILTRATREAIDHNELRILANKSDIGCSEKKCLLSAAIVVPLEMRGVAAGSLKFYYTTPRLLNETQVTMAEGLAKLLSTQLDLSELERQTQLATRMELKALQAQINPHFLFNTINTIASLIRTDPGCARELLRDFAAFYRRTLESSEELVPLERELEYVRNYLNFEHARFGDRIEVTEKIEPGALDELVPAFIVQPIVENAIQHGMKADGVLHIRISAACTARGLEMTVQDDGVGIEPARLSRILEPGTGRGLGIALMNVHDRLKGYFGPGSGLEVSSLMGQGTSVAMTMTHVEAGDTHAT